MRAWFFGLQMRERWIVGVGASAAVAIILWGFVVQPLRNEMAALRTAVDTKQRLIVDVARVQGSQPSSAGNRQGAEQTLVVIVDNTARSHGLDFPRTRANGPSGVDVTFQRASFDSLVAWLLVLHSTYGVDVETASFSNDGRAPGLVNGQLSLQRL
jgi:type II secretory pathway component PulM